MLQVLLLSVALISMGMLGMAIKIIVKKKGKFAQFQIGKNKDMKRLGISCVKSEELKCFRQLKKDGCDSCGDLLKNVS